MYFSNINTKNQAINIETKGKFGELKNLARKDNTENEKYFLRSIAESLDERVNTATDNEKEQVLGRVNVNGTTINVDSLLTLLAPYAYLNLLQPMLFFFYFFNNSKYF